MISLLYVDDDLALLDIFKFFMEETGDYSVDIFSSAYPALERLDQVQYDAIIVDYLLPDLDALQFLRILRNGGDETPFILFTGKGREEVAIDAFEGGADFYVQKGEDPRSQFTQIALKVNHAIDRRRSEKLLRESEERFRSFFEQSSVGCALNSPDGSWLYVNKKICEMTGYSESELLSMKWMDLVHPDIKDDEEHSFLDKLNKNGREFERIIQFIRKDGTVFDAQVSTIPINSPDGSILSYSSIIHDITIQKRTEEAIIHRDQLLAAIAECTGLLLQTMDPDKATAEILPIIGPATGQDRVYFCEATPTGDPGEFLITERDRWINPEIIFQSEKLDKTKTDCVLNNPSLFQKLQDGEIVSEVVTHSSYKDQMNSPDSDSIPSLLVPIAVEKKLWGFLRFETFSPVYEWKEGEKEALITVAGAIGSAKSRARIEQTIRETNDYLESLITHANGPIIVWDPNLLITRINRACEILIGMSSHEVIGKHLSIIVPPADRDRLLRLIQTTVSGVRWETVEIPVIHRNGSVRSVIWNSSTIFGPDAQTPLATIAQGQDITDTRRLEEEKERMVRQIQQNFAQQAILNDGIRNPLTVIQGHAEMIDDLNAREVISYHIRQINEMVTQLDRRWNESDKIIRYLQKHHHIAVPGLSPSGSSQDLPEQTVADLLAEEFQAELFLILDSVDALVYVVDIETYEVLYVNKKGRNELGNIIGQKCYHSLHIKENHPCSCCTNLELAVKGDFSKVIESVIFNPYTSRWYECRTRAIPWTDGKLVRLEIATDITGRKKYEEQIRESEEKYRSLYMMLRMMCDNVSDMIWAKDLNKRYLFANYAICEELLHAKSTDEPIGKTDLFFADRERKRHPENPEWCSFGEICQDSDAITLKNKRPMKFEEFGNVRGKYRILDVRKAPFVDGNGDIIGVVGTARDITRQREIEKQIHDSEMRLRTVVENLIDPVFIINFKGDFLFKNKAAESLFGNNNSSDFSSNLLKFIPESFKKKVYEDLLRIKANEGPIISEYEIKPKYGEIKQIEVAGNQVFWNGSQSVLMSFRDVTERKRIEENQRYYSGFRQMLARLSAGFINLPLDQITTGIQDAIEAMGEFANVDRSFVILLDKSGDYFSITSEWCAPGISPCFDRIQMVPVLQYSWWVEQIQDEHPIVLNTLDDLPPDSPEERFLLECQQVQSLLAVPIRTSDRSIGILGFTMVQEPAAWSEETISLIRMAADILASTLERKRVEEDNLQKSKQISLFTSITRHDIINTVMVLQFLIENIRMNSNTDVISADLEEISKNINIIRSDIEFTRVFDTLGVRAPGWQSLQRILNQIEVPSSIVLHFSDLPVEIYTDPMINKVFINLIHYSVYHGGPVSCIRIFAEESEGSLVIIYEDDGTGVAESEKERIFSRGYKRYTGLGMFLVREILSITGMTIQETGDPGNGLRFEIGVPNSGWRRIENDNL